MVNRHLEALEGRMTLNRMKKLVSHVREKRSKCVVVSSGPRFWVFHQKWATGRLHVPCRNMERGWVLGMCRSTEKVQLV